MKPVKTLISGLLLALTAGSAFAGTYQDNTANNSFQSAVDLSPYFGNGFSADVGNILGVNTSLSAPWVTISGHGNNDFDFYKVTTQATGQLIFDVDYTYNHPSNPHGFDTNLNVYNSAFTQIGYDDDQDATSGAGGSAHRYDSFVQLDNLAAGTYYVRVSKHYSSAIPVGSDYTLQVQGNVAAVPEPESYAMMGLGLALVGFAARRRKAKQA
jgi:serralysin